MAVSLRSLSPALRILSAAAFASLLLATGADATSSVVLTVSTTSDIVNGNVSSPAALRAHPGRDGISLREAIEASDNAAGARTITFARSLAGKTLTPTTFLPAFTRANVTLTGLTSGDGQPSVTLDAGRNVTGCCSGLLAVLASGVTISHIRIVGVRNDEIAIAVRAGDPGGASTLQNVGIDENVLDNGGGFGVGVWIGTDYPGYLKRSRHAGGKPTPYLGATGATLAGVTIDGNVIRGFADDGINVGLPGTHCAVSGLTIENNTFDSIDYANPGGAASPAVELDTSFSGNSITGTQITHNTFTHSWAGITLNGGVAGTNANGPISATGNVIDGTVISQNVFTGDNQGVVFNAGAGGPGAMQNTVSNTEISDDVFANNAPYGAVGMDGGGQGATGNRIVGVRFVNDTIAFNDGGVSLRQDPGDTIANIAVENTIFWSNGSDVGGPDAAAVEPIVAASLRGVDPRFVSAQDLHLRAGSPAIDAGTSAGAPPTDLDGRARVGQPDMGAYEFTG